MSYVVATTTTTDYVPGNGHVETIALYLLPIAKRRGAYWTPTLSSAEKFDTAEAAEAEIVRWRLNRYVATAVVIHTAGTDHLLTISEARVAARAAADEDQFGYDA